MATSTKKVKNGASKSTRRRAMKKTPGLLTRAQVERSFDAALEEVCQGGLLDFHTHLFPYVEGANFNQLAFFGPHRCVAYHYTYGRVFAEGRFSDKALKRYGKLSVEEQSSWLIDRLSDSGPELCESTRGLVTIASKLGVATGNRSLRTIFDDWCQLYADSSPSEYVDRIFATSPVNRVVSTNSIFSRTEYDLIYSQPEQMELWDRERFGFALRLDELIHGRNSSGKLKPQFAALAAEMGFAEAAGDIKRKKTQKACRALVQHWIARFQAEYAAVSLHGKTRLNKKDDVARIVLESAIIPACVEAGIPVVLMPFVRRQIKPLHLNAGDVVMQGDIDGLIDFMGKHQEAFFMVTPLSNNDHQALVMASRALGNVCLWGHWWINLIASTINAQARERFENLGLAHFGVNSDSRILDQILYKFDHYFSILKPIFVDYAMSAQTLNGRRPSKKGFKIWISQLQDHKRVLALAKGQTDGLVFAAAS